MDNCAKTPLEDHIQYAIKRMQQGARMLLDAIPNDSSLSSASFGPDVTAEIARRLLDLRRAREAWESADTVREKTIEECAKEADERAFGSWQGMWTAEEIATAIRALKATPAPAGSAPDIDALAGDPEPQPLPSPAPALSQERDALERIALLDECDGHELTVKQAFDAIAIATKALGKHPSEVFFERRARSLTTGREPRRR